MAATEPIPMPPAWPLLGHVMEFTTGKPNENLTRLSKAHGPIFRLNLGKRPVTFVTNQKLVNEICDEKRFVKSMKTVLGVSCTAADSKKRYY
jgi:cytochrome P450/NADPH-cytochrome P450 reductase